MNYEEALNKVESFMVKSGIREFCSDVCQGYCCNGCYTSKHACHKSDGRRLSCSVFICMSLRNILFNSTDMESYMEMEKMVMNGLSKASGKKWINIYYYPHSKKMRDEFLIEDKFLNILDKIDVKEVKNKLNFITNIHKVSSRFLVQKLKKCGK